MFSIDTMSRTPLYEQLVLQTETFILRGILKVGDALPSVRKLSHDLAINPNTIQKAYGELCSRGIIAAVPGRGNFVAPDAAALLRAASRSRLTEFKALAQSLAEAGLSEEELLAGVHDACATVQRTQNARKGDETS